MKFWCFGNKDWFSRDAVMTEENCVLVDKVRWAANKQNTDGLTQTSWICCCGLSALWSMVKGFCFNCLTSTSSNHSLNNSRPSRSFPHLSRAPSNWHSLSVSCQNTHHMRVHTLVCRTADRLVYWHKTEVTRMLLCMPLVMMMMCEWVSRV